jgi:hypothetical protein
LGKRLGERRKEIGIRHLEISKISYTFALIFRDETLKTENKEF